MSAMTGRSVVVPSKARRISSPRHSSTAVAASSSVKPSSLPLRLGSTSFLAASVLGWRNTSCTSPISAMWLSAIIATREHMRSTTRISWVITTTVTPIVRFMSLSSSRMLSVVVGSSALVASSHSSTRGLLASARAIATRCFMPPESCAGYAPSRPSRPTVFKSPSRACRPPPSACEPAPAESGRFAAPCAASEGRSPGISCRCSAGPRAEPCP